MAKCRWILLGLATLAFAGCSEKRSSSEYSAPPPSALPIDQPAPASPMVDQLQKERDELITRSAARLDELDRRIAAYEASVQGELNGDPGSARMVVTSKLREARAEAADALAKAKAAGRESWGNARTTMDAAFAKLDKAYADAVADMQH